MDLGKTSSLHKPVVFKFLCLFPGVCVYSTHVTYLYTHMDFDFPLSGKRAHVRSE